MECHRSKSCAVSGSLTRHSVHPCAIFHGNAAFRKDRHKIKVATFFCALVRAKGTQTLGVGGCLIDVVHRVLHKGASCENVLRNTCV